MKIGKKVKMLMLKKGLTYEQVAKQTGLSKTTIYLTVNDKQEIKVSVLEKISIVLNVPIAVFFTNEDLSSKTNQNDLEKRIVILESVIELIKLAIKTTNH